MTHEEQIRIPGLIWGVRDEFVKCCNFHVNLMDAERDEVILTDLTEWDIRSVALLVHRGVIKHTDVYLLEHADSERQELHFNPDGRIAEEFISHILSMNSDLVYEIFGSMPFPG